MKTYTLHVAGLTRELPIIKLSYDLSIASFVILGDTEIVKKTAPMIAKKLPEVDFVVTAEAKGIPLAYEISKILNLNEYIFYDGLPAPKKTGINEYRYLLPVPNEARIKDGDIKVFISNIKSNELEHHYIRR